MQAEIDMAKFNADLRRYQALSGLTMFQVMQQKGTDLAFKISERLMSSTPGKGLVTAERLAALKAGEGIRIREGLREIVMAKYRAASDISSKKILIGKGKRKRGSVVSKKKRLNLQALTVKRELALRERGRGYRPFATKISLKQLASGRLGGLEEKYGEYHQVLARYGITSSTNNHSATFIWGGKHSDIAEALSNASGRAAIQAGINDVRADMKPYIERKLRENARLMFK